jgi:hypothetical protein
MFQLRSWLKYNIKLTSSPFHLSRTKHRVLMYLS